MKQAEIWRDDSIQKLTRGAVPTTEEEIKEKEESK